MSREEFFETSETLPSFPHPFKPLPSPVPPPPLRAPFHGFASAVNPARGPFGFRASQAGGGVRVRCEALRGRGFVQCGGILGQEPRQRRGGLSRPLGQEHGATGAEEAFLLVCVFVCFGIYFQVAFFLQIFGGAVSCPFQSINNFDDILFFKPFFYYFSSELLDSTSVDLLAVGVPTIYFTLFRYCLLKAGKRFSALTLRGARKPLTA